MITQSGTISGDKGIWLSRECLRRLLIGMIGAAQASRLSAGALNPMLSIFSKCQGLADHEIDALAIDEATLGFDSLAILELIVEVNRFFGLHKSGVEDYLLISRNIGGWLELLDQHKSLMDEKVDLTFTTSGSTGPPKHVNFSLDHLSEEISAQIGGPLRGIDRSGRVLALVPPQHIYGFLFSCLLPQQLGKSVLDLHQSVPTSATRIAKAGDLVVATPYQWSLISQGQGRFTDGVIGITSAGPSTAETWRIRESHNLARLIEVYGATETAGVGYRDEWNTAFRLLDHLKRQGDRVMRAGSPLALQDKLTWTGQDEFTVSGRIDEVIQVGGVNVSPIHVTNTLKQITGVVDATVRTDENKLRALIIPESDSEVFRKNFYQELGGKLAAPARPVEITFGNQMVRNKMGKIGDWKTVEH